MIAVTVFHNFESYHQKDTLSYYLSPNLYASLWSGLCRRTPPRRSGTDPKPICHFDPLLCGFLYLACFFVHASNFEIWSQSWEASMLGKKNKNDCFNNLIWMIAKICEIAQFTRATPGSSLVKHKGFNVLGIVCFRAFWFLKRSLISGRCKTEKRL